MVYLFCAAVYQMVDAVHSISTQIHAATAGHKRIELILKRSEFTLDLLLDTMMLIRGLMHYRNCIFAIFIKFTVYYQKKAHF